MEAIIKPIAFTLMHSIWLGAVVLFVYWICSKMINSTKAALRYNLASLLLLSFVAGVAFTFIHYYQSINYVGLNYSTDFTLLFISDEVNKTSQSLLSLLQQNLDVIVMIWFVGVLVMLIRMTGSFFYLRFLITKSKLVENAAWLNTVVRFKNILSIDRTIQLRLSKHVDVPCVMGALKPVILFPLSYVSLLSIEQVEIILAHELSHIKRHDFLVNILQSVVEILFFFNPFVWALSNIMKTEREHATDDMAVYILQDKTNYIKTLAAIEQVRFQPVLANGFASNNNLITRIKRLTGMKTQNLKDVKIIVLLVTAAMIMSFGWFSSKESESKAMVIDTNFVYEEEKENQYEDEFNEPDIDDNLDVEALNQTDISIDVDPEIENEVVFPSDPDPKSKDKSKSKSKESKKTKAPKPNDVPAPSPAPEAPKADEYFYGVDEDWSEWTAEFTEKFEQQLKDLEYLQEMDFEALMADVNRIVADIDVMNEHERRELIEASRHLAEEQRHLAEAHKQMAREAMENVREEQMRLKEELKVEMERLHEDLKRQEIEISKMEEEIRIMEANIKKFNFYLSSELVKDGYLEKGEEVERLDINKNGTMKVNGIKIKDQDAERYLKKYKEIMGHEPGGFQYTK